MEDFIYRLIIPIAILRDRDAHFVPSWLIKDAVSELNAPKLNRERVRSMMTKIANGFATSALGASLLSVPGGEARQATDWLMSQG